MTINKEGFREITVTLHMQFSEHDKTRPYTLSTYETRTVATGAIPATDPPLIPLCLSPLTDAPSQQVVHFGLYSKHDLPKTVTPRSLDLETGKFAGDLTGDVELEIFLRQQHSLSGSTASDSWPKRSPTVSGLVQ